MSQLNLTDEIIAYEQGDMNEAEAIIFFQELVDTGLAWTLQGHYGRTAKALIEAGYVNAVDAAENDLMLKAEGKANK